ncbi:hypothetical protein ABZ912_03890, partial [Nonomuraea angiospora]|uniref:hypothetical protein n=1 Tax=Nonomuraea angiospora TaxID=46172 RepID=UPI003469A99B
MKKINVESPPRRTQRTTPRERSVVGGMVASVIVPEAPFCTVASRRRDIGKAKGGELKRMRRNIQRVMQDPYTS